MLEEDVGKANGVRSWPANSLRPVSGMVERSLIAVTLGLGLVHTWAGRYSMSPDSMSYLDVGTAFFRHDWRGAFNAYWSPLYAWIQGLAIGVVKPAPRWEFPLAHLVNFGIFLVALVGFRFLLQSFFDFRRDSTFTADEAREYLPEWAIFLIAYPIFWWASMEMMPLYEIGPDLALSACTYFAAGLLLRARQSSGNWECLLLGFVLGVGYWVKAPFFLIALAFLGVGYAWHYRSGDWPRKMAFACVAFLVTAAPLVIALSAEKHRLTFGDSGKLNYAWFVAPQTFHRNWQGKEPSSGIPAHPTQQLWQDPPAYGFKGPMVGTYPPWLDPSYWNEGLRPHFALRPQIQALATDLMTEGALLLRAQPALLVAVVLLAALSGTGWFMEMRRLWPLLAITLFAFAMYAPVHVEPRFLGGFVAILFLTMMVAVRLRPEEERAGRYLAVAVFSVMTIGAIDTALRYATLRLAVPGTGPAPAIEHVVVAEQLQRMGLHEGENVAIIGDGTGAYWARLAKLHIVAEVMAANHGAQHYWRSPDATQRAVLAAFAKSGARAVIAEDPAVPPGAEWTRISDTRYYLRLLKGGSSPGFE